MRWARVAVAAVVAVVLAGVLSSILVSPEPTTAAVVGLSLALAALCTGRPGLLLLSTRTSALSVSVDDRATAVRRGRPTDPTHHPLRPRAPGQA